MLCSRGAAPIGALRASRPARIARKARIKAAERDTSVSALVKHFLAELAGGESDVERLKREERALRQRIGSLRAADRLWREDVHGRR